MGGIARFLYFLERRRQIVKLGYCGQVICYRRWYVRQEEMLWNSLARHTLRPNGADLLCLLDQRATVAAPERQDVHQEAAGNVLRFTYLAAYRCPADDVSDRNALDEAADETAFADFLRHSTSRVARHEVRYDADAAVVETPEQTVLEFRHFPLLVSTLPSSS
jgi:hypothetical protein